MIPRILIGSPIHQKKEILSEFFESLSHLAIDDLHVDFAFIDDHNEHNLLQEFCRQHTQTRIIRPQTPDQSINQDYHCDETTHHWQETLIWKVAEFKDRLIALALEEHYDYLFLVDSDLYLQPETLAHLIQLKKDIVSEVFWTKWSPDLRPLPQVWLFDQYQMYPAPRGETLSEADINQKTLEFLNQLSQPGTYKVGGLGACTLINAKTLAAGVSFQEIYNLGLVGEDRHFCVRAAALGFELFADTHYPPYHIYRESELIGLQEFKKKLTSESVHPQDMRVTQKSPSTRKDNSSDSGITLGMLLRNEAGRYLEEVLSHTTQYVSRAVILDDASEDNSAEICQSIFQEKGIPLTLISNKQAGFHNEILLRKQLWEMLIASHPSWILCLDADEIFEDSAPTQLRALSARNDVDYFAFSLYDMWSCTHYREDDNWTAHRYYRPLLLRYNPHFEYLWKETPQHCGRFPMNIINLQGEISPLRIKHLGWMKPQERLEKYFRYKRLDPHAAYGIASQYDSILDPSPNLVPWKD